MDKAIENPSFHLPEPTIIYQQRSVLWNLLAQFHLHSSGPMHCQFYILVPMALDKAGGTKASQRFREPKFVGMYNFVILYWGYTKQYDVWVGLTSN